MDYRIAAVTSRIYEVSAISSQHWIRQIPDWREWAENNINVFYLLCPDTIDTYMAELVEGKKKVTDAINKGVDVDVSEMDINFMVMKRLKDSGK